MNCRFIALITALSSLVAPAAASAQSAARSIEIRVRGDAALVPRVRAAADELLQRLHVQARVYSLDEPRADVAPPTPLAIATLDFRDPSVASIEIEDAATHEELTRRSLTEVSSLETGIEALVHVLYLAVESLLEVAARTPPSIPTPREPAAAPKVDAALAAREPFGLDVGPLFRLTSLGAQGLVPGAGLSLESRAELGQGHAGLWLSFAMRGSSELGHGPVPAQPLELRLVPTLDFPVSPRLLGCFALGAGLDRFEVETTQVSGTRRLISNHSVLNPVVTGMAGVRLPLPASAFLSALATVDLDLTSATGTPGLGTGAGTPASINTDAGGAAPSGQLSRFRAGLTLALSFTAAGSTRFATPNQQTAAPRLDASSTVGPQGASAKQ